MKRFVKIGIVVFAAIAILGLGACGGGGGTKPPSGSSDATLTSVKFGNETATMGTPAATYGSATAGAVTILQPNVEVVATPKDSSATVEAAVVKEGDTLNEDDFWPEFGLNDLATGDQVALKVTAADKTTKLYYKIGVTLADVALSTLTVGGNEVTLPTPGTTWQAAGGNAFVLFNYKESDQPAAGVAIAAASANAEATIQYARMTTGATEPVFSDSTTIRFADGDLLYVKVTGTSGSAFYKVKVNFIRNANIKYGSPAISADHAVATIDPLWNAADLETYTIDRIYAADSGTLLDPNEGLIDAIGKPTTMAKAKALWDEEGLYIYLDVIDPDISNVDNEHNSDSFELFVNEAYPSMVYANSNPLGGGSQYRLAANGQVSGEGGSPAAMNALNKYSVQRKADGTGYQMVLQVPWRLRAKFYDAAKYRNDWEFGFELQLNVAGTTETRYGVLVWNNIAHTNYQNANDYGIAKLFGQSGPLNYPPLPPTITANPQGGVKSSGESVTLSVTADNPVDGGILTYQWYSATSATAAGTAITGEFGPTYTFTAPDVTTFYYAEVTNTLNSRTNTISSARAGIIISNVPMIDKLTLAQNYAVYMFNLPDGATFGDYKSITVDYFLDAENYAKGIRSFRLHGNYKESEFGLVNGYMHYAFDTANAAYIYDDRGGGYINAAETGVGKANEWFTATLRLKDINGSGAPNPNASLAATSKPDDSDTGPFLFGIGIPGNAGEANAKVQLVKNITMVHGTDATKNVVTKAFFGFVGYPGAADGTYVRELVEEPEVPTVITPPPNMTMTPPLINKLPITARYQEIHRIDLGADFDIHLYDKLSVGIKFYDSTKTEITTIGNSFATIKFKDTASGNREFYNYGKDQPITNWEFPVNVQETFVNTKVRYLTFDSGDGSDQAQSNFADVAYIEISSVTFSLAAEPWAPPETEELIVTVDLTQDYAGSPAFATIATKVNGVLTFPAGGSAYGLIPISAEDAAKLATATSMKIDVQGSADNETCSFRYYLGNPGVSASWNGINALPTNATTGQPFSALVGENVAGFANKSAATMGCFILRQDSAVATVVTITSITITAEVPK